MTVPAAVPLVSVVVPVRDEAANLPALVAELIPVLEEISPGGHEVILVDDGSRDGTWQAIRTLAETWPAVQGFRLRRNFGKATALALGASRARGRWLVTMDGDGQDHPGEIAVLLTALDGGLDLVSGWKRTRHDPLRKRLPSRVFNYVTRLVSGLPLRDFNCGLKAASREVYQQLPLYGELHRYIPVLAHSLGYRVGEVPVEHRPRRAGRSKYGFERYLRGLLDLLTVVTITRYGPRPGHLFGGVGILLGAVGFAILSYLTFHWFTTTDPIGNRPLLLLGILLEVVAVQLVCAGLLAELVISRSGVAVPIANVVAEATGDDGARPRSAVHGVAIAPGS